jgi:hypothetical protein
MKVEAHAEWNDGTVRHETLGIERIPMSGHWLIAAAGIEHV